MAAKVVEYEELLQEESRRKKTTVGCYYQDVANVVLEEVGKSGSFVCPSLKHNAGEPVKSGSSMITDLVKYMLNRPVLSGRIGKWSLAFTEFTLVYCLKKSIKGQAIADFLAHHPGFDESIPEEVEIPVHGIKEPPWILKFYGSSSEGTAGADMVIISPTVVKTALSFNLDFPCTNNQAEYDALVIGLEILKDLQAKDIQIIGDSQLILRQYVPRQQNWEANELAQIASGLRLSEEFTHKLVLIQKNNHPSIIQRGLQFETFNLDVNLAGDWREELNSALQFPEKTIPYGLRMKILNYVLVEGDLYRKGMDKLLLRCIGFPKAMEVMKQVHEGVCSAHQSGIKMRWLVRRHGYYWPSMLKDCIRYSKGCQPYQKHGNIQRVPADEMYAIIKPWPFRGWAMDLIGKIYPSSSKGHNFIIVATDFFTKWVEAIPLKKVKQKDMVYFIKEHIICWFGIPKSIISDQGTMFVGSEVKDFAADYGIKLHCFSPYYLQDNGQAEASNKVLIKILHKMMEDNPRDWPRLMSETLWAYRTSKRTANGVSPFALAYGREAVLHMEIMVPSLRIAMQNHLIPEMYNESMITELEDLDDTRMQALNSLVIQKEKVARIYNKWVRKKSFH
ncbi:uncharacterized protein [Henckelia pumila]|uniref:uncharacterized protein n=1 Tax=Henckelia pumila TaxID=405737 RepID=UPI003C6E0C32